MPSQLNQARRRIAGEAPLEPVAKKKLRKRERTAVGWREWVALPELGIARIKAKIDTGARSSAIHAWNIRPFTRDGARWIAFDLHPVQRNNLVVVRCEARVSDRRQVRNSGGVAQHRYVIETVLSLGGTRWPIELTLTQRDEMGFRLLLGRTALKRRVTIDPGRSFLLTRPRRK